MPGVFRDLWRPQPRRPVVDQSGTAAPDADPTLMLPANRRNEPSQLRRRDATYATVGANQQWLRKRLSTNELGLADGDPTVRAPWADGSAYLRPAPRQPDAITALRQWILRRMNTTDLGLPDYDPTVRPPWQYANPWQLRPGLAAYPAIESMLAQVHLWQASTPTSLITDADPTIKAPYQDPWQRRRADPAGYAVQAWEAWARLRLTTNDLGLGDQDTSIRPLWTAANPYQLRWRDSTYAAIMAVLGQYHAWQASTPTAQDDADPVVTIRPTRAASPYQLWWRDSSVSAAGAWQAWARLRLNTNDLGLADFDVTLRVPWPYANPYQLRRLASSPAVLATLAQYRLWGASTPVDAEIIVPPAVSTGGFRPYRTFLIDEFGIEVRDDDEALVVLMLLMMP